MYNFYKKIYFFFNFIINALRELFGNTPLLNEIRQKDKFFVRAFYHCFLYKFLKKMQNVVEKKAIYQKMCPDFQNLYIILYF